MEVPRKKELILTHSTTPPASCGSATHPMLKHPAPHPSTPTQPRALASPQSGQSNARSPESYPRPPPSLTTRTRDRRYRSRSINRSSGTRQSLVTRRSLHDQAVAHITMVSRASENRFSRYDSSGTDFRDVTVPTARPQEDQMEPRSQARRLHETMHTHTCRHEGTTLEKRRLKISSTRPSETPEYLGEVG